MSDPDFGKVEQALSSLISSRRRSNNENWSHASQFMKGHFETLGMTQESLATLRVIIIAGTKGKGSTAAFVERILRACGYKTGLFTSPHLLDICERIQINGTPIHRDDFASNFWECFNALKAASERGGDMPVFFYFLTLLGLQVFMREQVDVAILEVGIGGRLDATNAVEFPAVCGVSSLGMDHMDLLGDTLALIAREKGGIFKPRTPAWTVAQAAEAAASLEERAAETDTPLRVAPALAAYERGGAQPPVCLGLQGAHQRLNAALAVALCRSWEERLVEEGRGTDATGRPPLAPLIHGDRALETATKRLEEMTQNILPRAYRQGLALAKWPGRCQIVRDSVETSGATSDGVPPQSSLSFFLDGAHTTESMETCAEWFAQASAQMEGETGADGESLQSASLASSTPPSVCRVCVFNCTPDRDPERLLGSLRSALRKHDACLHHAIFVPPTSSYASLTSAGPSADLRWQETLRSTWEHMGGCDRASREASAPELATNLAPSLSHPFLRDLSPSTPWSPRRTAVMPSLSSVLSGLRRCAREAPGLRLHVLVTGSLYVVGDLLKLLNGSN